MNNTHSEKPAQRIGSGLGLALAGLLLTGCPGSPQAPQPANSPASPAANSRKIVIRGSNTVGEELAPSWIAEFRKEHPDVSFDTEFKGTAYGIGSLIGGHCDLAGASKIASKESEEVASLHGVQLKEYVLGSYAVTLIANAANPISNLTSNQVFSLFTGAIGNWKGVGGPDAPVQLYIRDPVSGTHIGFKELAMANQPYTVGARFETNYQRIAEAVAKDPNGLGYVGFGQTAHEGIKGLSVDGIEATLANIQQNKYPYARTLRFYGDAQRQSSETTAFLNFVQSERGQAILAQLGNVPKP